MLRGLLCLGALCLMSATMAYAPVCGVIVVNPDTNDVIYSYNPDVKTQPASLTKMMTLKLVFSAIKKRKLSPLSKIVISKYAATQSPSKLGVKAGSSITVRQAILSLITKSANDVAVALAEHIGGSSENFVKMMNAEAKRIGMMSTHFVNPSGWKNSNQCTTARDMAKLSRSLLKEYPDFYHLFATKSFDYQNKHMQNHNKLLGKHSFLNRGKFIVDGIKTGYVTASGFNLAASATDGRMRLIAVVLGGRTQKQRDAHVKLLFQKGFPRAYAMQTRNYNKKMPSHIGAGNSRTAYLAQVGVLTPSPVVRASFKPRSTQKVFLRNFIKNYRKNMQN